MSGAGNPGTPEPESAGKQDLPVDDPEEEVPERPDDQPLWWPNMGESRAIMHDLVSQVEPPFGDQGVELPEDPDPGDES